MNTKGYPPSFSVRPQNKNKETNIIRAIIPVEEKKPEVIVEKKTEVIEEKKPEVVEKKKLIRKIKKVKKIVKEEKQEVERTKKESLVYDPILEKWILISE